MPWASLRWLVAVFLIVLIMMAIPWTSEAAPIDLAVSLNQVRYEHALPYLAGDWRLDAYAQAHAQRLADSGYLWHSDIGQLLGPWRMVGEIVGAGGSVYDLTLGFMASPPHAAVIVNEYTTLGVGSVESGGKLWVVAVFAA